MMSLDAPPVSAALSVPPRSGFPAAPDVVLELEPQPAAKAPTPATAIPSPACRSASRRVMWRPSPSASATLLLRVGSVALITTGLPPYPNPPSARVRNLQDCNVVGGRRAAGT